MLGMQVKPDGVVLKQCYDDISKLQEVALPKNFDNLDKVNDFA